VDTEGGYIKLFRSLKKRGILQDGPLWQVLGWAFLEAPRQRINTTYRTVPLTLNPGEIPFTQSELARELRLTSKQVRGAIDRGIRMGTWTILRAQERVRLGHSSVTPKGIPFSVLRLENFGGYQGWSGTKGIGEGATRAGLGHGSVAENPANPDPAEESGPLQEGRKEKEEKEKSPADFPPEAIEVCNLLVKRMRERDPKSKGPTTDKTKVAWLTEAERLHRIDGRPWREIREILEWTQSHHFWKSNIRSIPKLRQQYERLREQWLEDGNKEIRVKAKKADEEQAARAQRRLAEYRSQPRRETDETGRVPMPESAKAALEKLGILSMIGGGPSAEGDRDGEQRDPDRAPGAGPEDERDPERDAESHIHPGNVPPEEGSGR